MEREYDAAGNMVRERYLDAAGNVASVAAGHSGVAKEYDAANQVVRQTWLDAGGNPLENADRVASTVWEYEGSRQTLEAYLDARGRRVSLPGKGYAAVRREYDEWGHNTSVAYCDLGGSPVACDAGWARQLMRYDDAGMLVVNLNLPHYC